MATVGDIVVVISTASMFTSLKGSYGIVTEEYGDGQKVMVKFMEGLEGVGSLSHTAFPSELKVIGRVLEEE